MNIKRCELCDKGFSRGKNERFPAWERRRFCSVVCRNRKNTQFVKQQICKNGHPRKIGERQCRICSNAWAMRKYRKIHNPPILAYDPVSKMKRCGGCGIVKPVSFFAVRNDKTSRHDPYQALCNFCSIERYLLWVAINGTQKSEYQKMFYETNIEKIKQYDADRWALPETKERARRNVARNRDRYNAYGQAHRARKAAAVGSHYTAEDVARLKTEQNNCCVVCQIDFSVSGYHVDHIIAIANGGTNAAQNIQLLCPHCNVSKSDTDFAVFLQRRNKSSFLTI